MHGLTMNSLTIEQFSHKAKQHLMIKEQGPFLLCLWVDFVFIHYEVDRELLQADVPYTLDLYQGKAYISLVAFTLEAFRLAKGGLWTRWVTAPVSTQRYFNIRTYIKEEEKEGIYFMR